MEIHRRSDGVSDLRSRVPRLINYGQLIECEMLLSWLLSKPIQTPAIQTEK